LEPRHFWRRISRAYWTFEQASGDLRTSKLQSESATLQKGTDGLAADKQRAGQDVWANIWSAVLAVR
jgi:hypothetical protein